MRRLRQNEMPSSRGCVEVSLSPPHPCALAATGTKDDVSLVVVMADKGVVTVLSYLSDSFILDALRFAALLQPVCRLQMRIVIIRILSC